jgi:hypothetical protein
VNARGGKNREPLHKWSTKKDITGKQREGNSLDPVFPLVSCGIKRQESFKPLTRQDLLDTLFVLVTSVKSVPGVAGIEVSQCYFSLGRKPDSSAT